MSAQRAGAHQAVTGLKAWSPARYGALDVTKSGTITDDFNAAFDAMVAWVRDGIPPASGQDIEAYCGGGQYSVVTRGSFGNAAGGIRLSQHEVPTGTNSGENTRWRVVDPGTNGGRPEGPPPFPSWRRG